VNPILIHDVPAAASVVPTTPETTCVLLDLAMRATEKENLASFIAPPPVPLKEKEAETAESIVLHLVVLVACKNAMTGLGKQVSKARAEIENLVLNEFEMKKTKEENALWSSTAEYELRIFHPDGLGLALQVQDIARRCDQLAEKEKCIAKVELKA